MWPRPSIPAVYHPGAPDLELYLEIPLGWPAGSEPNEIIVVSYLQASNSDSMASQ